MKPRAKRLCLAGLACAVAGAPLLRAEPAPAGRPGLTIETFARGRQTWIGATPDEIRWAPDGQSIHFAWRPRQPEAASLYAVRPAGGAPTPVPIDLERNLPPWQRPRFAMADRDTTRTRSHVVYERQGDIFLLEIATGAVKRVTNTDASEQNPRFSHDASKITFESANNLFAYSIATGELTQLTNFKSGSTPRSRTDQQKYLAAQQLELFEHVRLAAQAGREQRERAAGLAGPRAAPSLLGNLERVIELQLSPDERSVTFTLVDDSRTAADTSIVLPDFVTASGYVETITAPPGAVKAREAVTDFRLGIVTLPEGKLSYVDPKPFGKPVNWNPLTWSEDGERAVTWVGSQDHKDLWLCLIDVRNAVAKVLYAEHDDAFVRGFRGGRVENEVPTAVGFLADGSVFFQSEKDGWYQLYSVREGGEPRQLTRGRCEVEAPVLSRDKASWYFLSCEGDSTERHLYRMPVAGGPPTRLTPAGGWCGEFVLSPDETQVAFSYETPAAPPELFVAATQGGPAARRLTTSTSEEFRRSAWPAPEYVSFPDKDGWSVRGELFKPARPHPLRPAILHVHGGGWEQGVAKRFASYMPVNRAEFQLYAEMGYTVLNVDYKGSKGYGREGRVALYRDAMGPPVESLVAAVEYLVARHGVDRARIGVYGHSFGGSVTLAALFMRPGTFRAGAAQSAQADFAHAQPHNFINRYLNVPWQDEEAYRRSSPIYHVDRFRDRLLLLSGVLDRPMPFQSTLRLVQRLIELGKTGWDLAVYPVEGHVPQDDSSLLDLERRRFAFFESVLKEPSRPR